MKKAISILLWLTVAVAGAAAYFVIATRRDEPLNSAYLLIAAFCTYAIGYRFYSKWIAARVLALDDRRATPCEVHEDGKDFVKTNKWIVFGHHFAAISGPGPLVGPVLAAQFGYLPGTLWILVGVVLGGAVHDFIILFSSMRRDGRSLAQMLRDEINRPAGVIGLIAVLAIMIIILAVLALVVVKALAESPWGVFTVGATIPIAMLMGGYLRYVRIGKVLEVSAIGVVLLLLAVWGGKAVHADPAWHQAFKIGAEPLAWSIIAYGFLASVLPVWLLLAPRDYLSTFMKLGTIAALAIGTLLVLPELRMPALSKFVDGSGLVVSGALFPFCFITIACGAISGFHALISSGITPKIIARESHARPVGYGAMCLESLVAIMAMIAACTLEPGTYLAMNVPGTDGIATAQKITASGFAALQSVGGSAFQMMPVIVSPEAMTALAAQMGEVTLFGRTGGASTLAVGMAQIFGRLTAGRWLDLWYHFALMFEALFILTTLDAGTRVGRYLLQDTLGRLWKPLASTHSLGANLVASGLIVLAWGFFLIAGVRDPEGGVKALWPIFGIANQLLAGIALCLCTTIILKMQLQRQRPASLILVTLVPLAFLLIVTVTAGVQKVWHPNERIGFLAAAHAQDARLPILEKAADDARATGDAPLAAKAAKAVRDAQTLRFNNRVDAVVVCVFLVLVAAILALSVTEWLKLCRGARPPQLSETEPTWLPAGTIILERPLPVMGLAVLAFTMLKELSGQAAVDRAQALAERCDCIHAQTPRGRQNVFLSTAARRFEGVNRCC